ncbi:hypothetical protein EIP91_005337 [Steccherinum ochraceum]|uniref:Signal recognition particle subunit SRP14 n=1 Tax=Steccherinum ochraceum TaxID=92696 RepID=A0A4R0RMH6_9APHY|nr:hypothetical protein EIP91_005337 [Steccherinum ochraceum]
MGSGDATDTNEYPCLIRVTDGKDLKLSTKVEPGDLEKFHATYGTLLKASMGSLRKRDKKREKQRQEDAARRKRRLAEQIAVEGPKRGNGRRKRQRLVKRAIRLEETRKRSQEREEAKGKTRAA